MFDARRSESASGALPSMPGVYFLDGPGGEVLYIGAARDIAARVQAHADDGETSGSLDEVRSIVTGDEVCALRLCASLVRAHQPRHNIVVTARPVWLRIDPREPWPRVERRWRAEPDGARYYEFANWRVATAAMRTIAGHFGLRTCSDSDLRNRSSPCAEHRVGRCDEVAHGVAVASILSERSPVRIAVASEGPDTSVVAAASLRAVRAAGQSAVQQERVAERLRDLADLLGLVRPPRRIECFDVSNLHAHCVVVGMVVFIDGKPHPKCWRSFQMEREAPDDCACLAEALRARMRTAEGSEPDLIVIDGGRGQLNAVRDMMTRTPAAPRLVAIAKAREGKPERLFVPERSEALIPVVGSPGLALLQQVRDAAHEHALAAHRGMRRRQGMRGSLEGVPGVGAKRRRSLLRHFGSLERIRERTAGEIASVHGISPAVAQQIVAHLRAM
jgi:excinuclease UvrABC nuclease subunit